MWLKTSVCDAPQVKKSSDYLNCRNSYKKAMQGFKTALGIPIFPYSMKWYFVVWHIESHIECMSSIFTGISLSPNIFRIYIVYGVCRKREHQLCDRRVAVYYAKLFLQNWPSEWFARRTFVWHQQTVPNAQNVGELDEQWISIVSHIVCFHTFMDMFCWKQR